jgi:hypothetical protein
MSYDGGWKWVYRANSLFRLARNIDYMTAPRRNYQRQRQYRRYVPQPQPHHSSLGWFIFFVVVVWALLGGR